MNSLLELLKYRYKVSEAHNKNQHEEIKRCIADYEAAEYKRGGLGKVSSSNTVRTVLDSEGRYVIRIPYIFATHESMLASFFDREPDLVFRGRGQDDYEKEEKVKATYQYLIDKTDFPLFMNETAWWFILTGNTYGGAVFKSETKQVPMYDDMGEVMVDENGKELTREVYIYNDPVLNSYDPLKLYFSPEAKFKENASEVPYFFYKAQMEVDEIKNVYGVEVEPDSTIKIELNGVEKDNDDIKRATVYFYQGQIPEKHKKEVKNWKYGNNYNIIYTDNKILLKEEINEKTIRLGSWYRIPNKFYGFGIGKTLRELQKEIIIRRSQQIRFADLNAFPKIAVDGTTEVDEKALLDPRVNTVLVYKEAPPQYLTPPPMSDTILGMDEIARRDAQFVSGMMDLTNAAQSTSVDTATGQTIFADAAERRIRQGKRQFGRFIREVVILMLKLAQENWDEEKLVSITDEDGMSKEMVLTKYDLQDIDFDRDIDVDLENISVNKDVLRAQAIEMYDRIKDDPLVDRAKVFKKMLRDGFNEQNPDNFLKSEEEVMQEQMQEMQQGDMPKPSPRNGEMPTSQEAVASTPFQNLF